MTLFGDVLPLTGTDEFYTPAWLFGLMGLSFDIDVAAPPGGVDHVPAARSFDIHDDGLSQDWRGLVWCNPPYSNATGWAEKWSEHSDGIFLGPLAKSKWLARLLNQSEIAWVPQNEIFFDWPAERTGPNRGKSSYQLFLAGRGGGVGGVERVAASVSGALLKPEKREWI